MVEELAVQPRAALAPGVGAEPSLDPRVVGDPDDPLVSAAHFFVTVPLLPYKMGVEPPCECEYTLGYYRPGSCAPWIIDGIPISLRGMALECTAATGAAIAIP